MATLKWLLSLGIVAGVSVGAFSAGDDDRESAKRVEELAGTYEFFTDAGLKTKFERQPKPLLKYTNPVRGEVYGNVFVWTHQGRPEVIGAVFDYRSERTLYSEMHTLARGGVVARRDGKEFWKPSEAGAKFRAVPGAPVPADTDKARLLQMRELARGFAVERKHPEHGKEAMRMMAHPIFRYDSPQTKTLDGAIFVFVDETTDPEVYLLLEASGGDKPTWQFALARMNIVEFRAEYKNETVWSVKEVDWATVYDRHEPYAIVREKPSRGFVRKP
ncbi:Uncharacterized protein OS=Planctomyces maris DSM 8797 GN=PM8797T_23941 PE=4 SV=1 [Gemmata massiliana]|uniref:Uncharacterized protein n=1 Tax=Gemmata massiliana TaxID=1210884 RepID=A0A6P2D4F2_9BACT|nr:hypothetical protein [Gemmata massiliana]VTR96181.1 Uncharacterized protein OS=Planctomyces maris DSM 8797 GN=PM8797T_23941 PE=4 SV=1 [Gemmata massiliana]